MKTLNLMRRLGLLAAMLFIFVLGAKADSYMIYYDNGTTRYYMANVNGTLTAVTDYDETNCVWDGTSGSTFSNNGKSIGFSTTNASSVSLSASAQMLTINDGGHICYSSWTGAKYYIYYNTSNNTFCVSTQSGDYVRSQSRETTERLN